MTFTVDINGDARFIPALDALGPNLKAAVLAVLDMVNQAKIPKTNFQNSFNLQPLIIPSNATYPGGPDYFTFDLLLGIWTVRIATADFGVGHVCVSAKLI